MFGFARKNSSRSADEDRLAEWQRSPSVPVTKATGLKTKILLANLGRELKVQYRNESLTIRPVSVFRKPAYNRMYVEAQCAGETKILNISDLMIRRPDSDTYFDDDEPTTQRSSLPILSVLVILFALGGAAAVYLDVVPLDLAALIGNRAAQDDENWTPPGGGVQPITEQERSPPGNEAPTSEAREDSPFEQPDAVASPQTPSASPSTAEPFADATFGREFTDTTGGFRTRAEFVEFQPDRGRGSRVILRKADGTQLDVAMNSLSKEDQDWIRAEVKRRKAP